MEPASRRLLRARSNDASRDSKRVARPCDGEESRRAGFNYARDETRELKRARQSRKVRGRERENDR